MQKKLTENNKKKSISTLGFSNFRYFIAQTSKIIYFEKITEVSRMEVHTCCFSTQEAKAGALKASLGYIRKPGNSGLLNETLSKKKKS